MKTLIYRCFISRKALASGSIHNWRLTPSGLFNQTTVTTYYLFYLLSGTLSSALRLIPKLKLDKLGNQDLCWGLRRPSKKANQPYLPQVDQHS